MEQKQMKEGDTETVNMDVPANALTTCPLQRYLQVSIAKRCVGCDKFRGLADTMGPPADIAQVSFSKRYRVLCGVPQVREISMFDQGD